MGFLATKLREQYKQRLAGEMEFADVVVEGMTCRVYWKPLTGRQQKAITKAAENSITEGILMQVKVRALDAEGQREFKDVTLLQMMNDFDFDELSRVYIAMTGIQFDAETIAGN